MTYPHCPKAGKMDQGIRKRRIRGWRWTGSQKQKQALKEALKGVVGCVMAASLKASSNLIEPRNSKGEKTASGLQFLQSILQENWVQRNGLQKPVRRIQVKRERASSEPPFCSWRRNVPVPGWWRCRTRLYSIGFPRLADNQFFMDRLV